MPGKTPDELDADAARLRGRAAEIEDANPLAGDYHRLRADWCERLARDAREDATDAG